MRGGGGDDDVNMAHADQEVANEGVSGVQTNDIDENYEESDDHNDTNVSNVSRRHTTSTTSTTAPHADVARVKSAQDASTRVKGTPVPQNRHNMIQTMRWGLLHHQYTADLPAHTANTINARAETLLESDRGIWASIKATNRCVLVCDG
jgi:putative SOS response-associated peptidase YedK